MYVEPKYKNVSGGKIYFSEKTRINGYTEQWMNEKLPQMFVSDTDGIFCSSITVIIGIPKSVSDRIPNWKYNPEGFVLILGAEAYIYAEQRALHTAFSTLIQLCESNEAKEMLLWDYPACPIRGYRMFVPSRAELGLFYETVNRLEKNRFNYLIMEVGGAMEYKTHPEVNIGWVKYCEEMREYTGKSIEVQYLSFDWCKNSIHADNCGGDYLTQDELRELVRYCRNHGIEIIPEMPSLSHCDYMLTMHPELAERHEDPYPDTYCPSNEGSYNLYFDLLGEVVDVINPQIVNIGHDELMSIALCENCKTKNPAELMAKDITRIHDWLQARGIKTMMWIDKLFEGHECGGETHIKTTKNGTVCVIPEVYTARDMIPRDIILLNWRAEKEDQEKILSDMGFEIVFGNFPPFGVNNFRKRINDGVMGAFFSNWGSLGKTETQRNGVILREFASAYVLWDDKCENADFDNIYSAALEKIHSESISHIKNPVTILHTTDCLMKNYVFYDGVFFDEAIWHMGDYCISYTDGTTALLPVRYGCEISNKNLWFSGQNPAMNGIVGQALPIKLDGEKHNPIFYNTPYLYNPPVKNEEVNVDYQVYYSCVYENPFPEKEISDIEYRPNENWECVGNSDEPIINNSNLVDVKEIKIGKETWVKKK